MQNLIKHRPSPAMVVACLALLVALTGTSVAAVSALAPNSVGPAQLREGAVTNGKLRNNSVTGDKVANRSLTSVDFVAGTLPRGPRGAAGPAGPAGPAGAAGPAGPAGVIGAVTVRQGGVVVPGGTAQDGSYDTETVTVNCNANEKAISAGTGWSDDVADRELWTQRMTPLLTGSNVTGFRATGGNDSGNSSTFTLYVLCYSG
jgi:hypothetical protein